MTTDPSNAFLTMLKDLQGGATQAELHHAITELVGEVRSTGRAGTLTFTLKIQPKAQSGQIVIVDEVKINPPKPDREITIMFADDDNRLTRRDPRQPVLSGMTDVRRWPAAAVGDDSAAPPNLDRSTGELKE